MKTPFIGWKTFYVYPEDLVKKKNHFFDGK